MPRLRSVAYISTAYVNINQPPLTRVEERCERAEGRQLRRQAGEGPSGEGICTPQPPSARAGLLR
jgi:hypothetical protein